MQTELETGEDRTAPVAQGTPRVPWRVVELRIEPDFRLWVRFIDGLEGNVDLKQLVHSPNAGVFSDLRDPALFKQVYIDYGAVTWPGEIDLAPDAMHDEIEKHGIWIVPA